MYGRARNVRGLAELVSVLVRHDVRFIIVGGMAGALRGAPVNTLDLDIVYARAAENVGSEQPSRSGVGRA